MKKNKIIILGCGGTIAMIHDEHTGALRPAKTINEIVEMVPKVKDIVDVELEQLWNIDSTELTPNNWSVLTTKIADLLERYDGVVVTHGTDTMAYSATAVSLGLGRGLKKPVVFTGSQLPLMAFRTDAVANLEEAVNAVNLAINQHIAEVMIVFDRFVFRGNRTVKISEARFGAFNSPAFPALAESTAVGLSFIPESLKADDNEKMDLKPNFNSDILTIELTPGLKPSFLRLLVDSGTCQGILLKSLGAGNVPSIDEFSLIPIIKRAAELNIPVVITTKFVGGMVHMDIYEPGMKALEAGAIPARDMTDVAAQVKFMWALAQGYRKPDELRKVMLHDFVGEVTEAEGN